MANEKVDSEGPDHEGYKRWRDNLWLVIDGTSMATAMAFSHFEFQLDGQIQIVIERLCAMIEKINWMPLNDKNNYFNSNEYQQFMRYIQLCPVTNAITRGSIGGALDYIHFMRNEINQRLQSLEQENHTNYIEWEPSIVAFSNWLYSYAEYNPLPDFWD